MNRRTFFSKLVAGLLAAPVIAKVIAEPKERYYDGVNEYFRCEPFELNGVSGNYASISDSSKQSLERMGSFWLIASTDGTSKYSTDEGVTWVHNKPLPL